MKRLAPPAWLLNLLSLLPISAPAAAAPAGWCLGLRGGSTGFGTSTGTRRVFPRCWLYWRHQPSSRPLPPSSGMQYSAREALDSLSHMPSSLVVWKKRYFTYSRMVVRSLTQVCKFKCKSCLYTELPELAQLIWVPDPVMWLSFNLLLCKRKLLSRLYIVAHT